MLTGIHIILTYACTLECDHCFVHSGPRAPGSMTLSRIDELLREARKIDSLEWIYFEGGEPFLLYPILVEGIRLARASGLRVGVVTNAYGAVSMEDAEVWFRPLADLGVESVNISDDRFHYEEEHSPAETGVAAARKLGLAVGPHLHPQALRRGPAGRRPVQGRPRHRRGGPCSAAGPPKSSWTTCRASPGRNSRHAPTRPSTRRRGSTWTRTAMSTCARA